MLKLDDDLREVIREGKKYLEIDDFKGFMNYLIEVGLTPKAQHAILTVMQQVGIDNDRFLHLDNIKYVTLPKENDISKLDKAYQSLSSTMKTHFFIDNTYILRDDGSHFIYNPQMQKTILENDDLYNKIEKDINPIIKVDRNIFQNGDMIEVGGKMYLALDSDRLIKCNGYESNNCDYSNGELFNLVQYHCRAAERQINHAFGE